MTTVVWGATRGIVAEIFSAACVETADCVVVYIYNARVSNDFTVNVYVEHLGKAADDVTP
ncbi:MAG: hypothetical protein HQL61_09170 [Magnetococcales bacterium]|nr:hypothetical protein [Nitrospirota bacterium]